VKKPFVCIAILLFLAACNTSSQEDTVVFSEPLPESEGELLYLDMKCPTCHGYQGEGDGFLSAGLHPKAADFSSAEAMASIPDAQLMDAIRNGKGKGMPSFAGFTDHQVEALVQYIRSLSQESSN
jgi:mono/diheme cytochrome c family protein